MKRLFNLKEWLTINEAAKYLSIVFSEEVTEADVYRLGLDGHLTLSVNFVNHAIGRIEEVVPMDQATMHVVNHPMKAGSTQGIWKTVRMNEFKDLPKEIQNGVSSGELILVPAERAISEKEAIKTTDKIIALTGVWDLPMIGGERLDVEHAYQLLTGGPEVTLSDIDGAYVKSADRLIANIQESYDDNEYQSGSRANLEDLKQKITEKEIPPEKAEETLKKWRQDRKRFLDSRRNQPATERYYPSGKLPDDSVLVVRTGALHELEESLINTQTGAKKKLTATERTSLLTIIAALCKYSDINLEKIGAAVKIAELTEQIGAPVSDDTVRRFLKSIPDAVESRMK